MQKLLLLVLISFTIFLKADVINVSASILPQEYFIQKIAKDKVNVNVMVKPGFSAATYEPKISQMKLLSKSKIYFSIGVPFESSWLKKFQNSNKNMKIVDTSKGIKKIAMIEHKHHDEHHDDKHDDEHHDDKHDDEHHVDKHDDEHHDDKHNDDHWFSWFTKLFFDDDHHDDHGLDPHVWLDPILVKIQAKNIYEALIKIDKKNEEFYYNNYLKFLEELDKLNEKIATILKPVKDKSFMIFHPALGYFAKRYDINQIAIEKEGKDPKPKEILELIKKAKENNIKVVFAAKQFSQKTAKSISKNINGKVILMNPLSKEYDINLLKIAQDVSDSYK